MLQTFTKRRDKKKLLLGVLLLFLGLVGIASILTMDLPLPAEAEAVLKENFTNWQIQLLLLINPGLMLLVGVTAGTLLYQETRLSLPILERIVGFKSKPDLKGITVYGIAGGLLSGVLITMISWGFSPFLPEEFQELSRSIQPGVAVRLLYGGITEEILMRFGLMTFVVWLSYKILKNRGSQIYWTGILVAALIFAIAHFPIAYQAVEQPSLALLSYILLGNTLGGIIFGWLYWKKGLEAAFIGHMMAHLVMLFLETT